MIYFVQFNQDTENERFYLKRFDKQLYMGLKRTDETLSEWASLSKDSIWHFYFILLNNLTYHLCDLPLANDLLENDVWHKIGISFKGQIGEFAFFYNDRYGSKDSWSTVSELLNSKINEKVLKTWRNCSSMPLTKRKRFHTRFCLVKYTWEPTLKEIPPLTSTVTSVVSKFTTKLWTRLSSIMWPSIANLSSSNHKIVVPRTTSTTMECAIGSHWTRWASPMPRSNVHLQPTKRLLTKANSCGPKRNITTNLWVEFSDRVLEPPSFGWDWITDGRATHGKPGEARGILIGRRNNELVFFQLWRAWCRNRPSHLEPNCDVWRRQEMR